MVNKKKCLSNTPSYLELKDLYTYIVYNPIKYNSTKFPYCMLVWYMAVMAVIYSNIQVIIKEANIFKRMEAVADIHVA